MICVSYTRLTSCTDEAVTIERQNEIIREFADKNGLKIAKKYCDRKNDPKADTSFQQLSNDGIARKYDIVILYSMFSFGPSTYVGYDLLSKTFVPCGIQFAVAVDGFLSWEHSEEDTQNYLRNKYKEYSTYIHRKDVWKANKNRSIEKYGYRVNQDTLQYDLDESAAEIVREIFTRTLKGEMPTQIARTLNNKKISSPMQRFAELRGDDATRENGWTVLWVKNILHTVHYTGKYMRNIEGDIQECCCPQIISSCDFEAVQNIFQQRKHKEPPRVRFVNPFLGKLFDCQTGLPLAVVYNRYRDYYEYKPRFQDKEKMNYEKNKWLFDDVFKQAVDFLNHEREKAKKVLKIIDSKKGQSEITGKIDEIKEKRDCVFHQLLDLAGILLPESKDVKGNDEFIRLDTLLNQLSEEIKTLEKVYSKDNPWIKRYLFEGLPEEMEMKDFGRLFSKVLSHEFDSLDFFAVESEWREMLPTEWR